MKKVIAGIAFLFLFAAGLLAASFKVGRDPVYSERDTWFDQLSLNAGGFDSITDIFCYTYKDAEDREHHCMLMPSCADMGSCVVKFLYADHIVVVFPSGEEASYKSNTVIKGMEAGKDYPVRFEDTDGNILREGILSIICSESLPSVFITTSSGTMDAINADMEYREKGELLVMDEEGRTDTASELEYLKGHGNTSWEMVKKAYQFKMTAGKEILGLGASKKWVLTANYDYSSEEKNAFAYELARFAGLRGTPEFKYADLYFNGQYQGLYLIGGKIETGEDRLDINDLEYRNKMINDSAQNEDHETNAAPGEQISYDLGGDPADITGGYIIERDYALMGKILDHASRFTTLKGDTYGIKEPYIATKREAAYIAGVFQELEDRIYAGEDISDVADIKSFADKYLLEELLKNSACGSTSTYFYKDSDMTDPLIHAGPAWDYDKSMGSTRQELADDPTTMNFCTMHPDTSYLFYMLYMKNAGFRKLVKEEYSEVFRPYLTEAVSDGGAIDRIRDEYGRNNNMDAIRWSKPDTDYIVHADWMKEFLRKRIETADRIYLKNEPVDILSYTDQFDSVHYIGVIHGEKPQKLPDGAEKSLSSNGQIHIGAP